MNNEPYIIFSNNNFIILYKPPYWKVDTSTNYELLSIENQKKELNKPIKSFQLYTKFLLIDKFKNNPLENRQQLYYDTIKYNETYNLCHRYDQETSGAMLVSLKNNKLEYYINIIGNKNNTIKIYLTLVNGKVKQKNGFIRKNIECQKINNYNYCIATDDKKINSISYYNVIGYIKFNHKVYSLVHVKIFTGKTHQIRLHMKTLGHPIVSDDKYNDIDIFTKNKKIISRIFIHNIYLSFRDDNFPNNFTIPIADDIFRVLNNINIKKIYKDIYDVSKLLDIKI